MDFKPASNSSLFESHIQCKKNVCLNLPLISIFNFCSNFFFLHIYQLFFILKADAQRKAKKNNCNPINVFLNQFCSNQWLILIPPSYSLSIMYKPKACCNWAHGLSCWSSDRVRIIHRSIGLSGREGWATYLCFIKGTQSQDETTYVNSFWKQAVLKRQN